MNQVGTYNSLDFMVRRVFFTGTATLTQGQILNYQDNPASTATDRVKGFPFDVQLPDSSNLNTFAGILAEDSIGKVGPCFVNIVVPRPGDILQVKVSRATDVAVDDLLKANYTIGTNTASSTLGAFDEFSTAVVSSTDITVAAWVAAFKITPLAQALESVASTSTSSATALLWVRFQ